MKKRVILLLLVITSAALLGSCQADPPAEEDSGTTVSEQSTEDVSAGETTAPVSAAPDTDAPESTVSETNAPETTVTETTVPETAESETTEPETAESETAESETTEPETEASETAAPETEPALDGSFSTPDYTVSVQDGLCYLNFTDASQEEEESGAGGQNQITVVKNFLAFSSVADMKQAFRENGLTEKQRKIIRTHFTRTDKGYEICNLDQLLCPATPEGFAVKAVYLYGADYKYSVWGAGELSASVNLGDAGKYERDYNQNMEMIAQHQLDSHTAETYDGVICESYVFSTSVAQFKYVFMTLPAEGNDVPARVIMRFLLQSQNQPDEVSSTVPQAVFIYGEESGMPYFYMMHGLFEAPTVEWLSSFGLALYEDEAPEAKQ